MLQNGIMKSVRVLWSISEYIARRVFSFPALPVIRLLPYHQFVSTTKRACLLPPFTRRNFKIYATGFALFKNWHLNLIQRKTLSLKTFQIVLNGSCLLISHSIGTSIILKPLL